MRAVALTLAALLLFALSGCASSPDTELRTEPLALTVDEALALADEADAGRAGGVDVEDASEARSEALAGLRKRGEEGEQVADLLTAGFPGDLASVPILAQAAVIDGEEAWVVVEAYGDAEGALTHRRVWVFASDGTIITTAATR